MKKATIVLALAMLLATTASLVALNMFYHEKLNWAGEIIISSQEQYHNFADAIFTDEVKVNALYKKGNSTPLTIKEVRLWTEYPYQLPAGLGFNLDSMQNPLADLPGVKFYGGVYGGDSSGGYGRFIYSLSIAMVGYSLTVGLWVSRNGIYEKPNMGR